ncbi:MAG: hypothetical protein K9J27_06890 [Bacteroidales bacterium]|nr:hypothetical protein [Bacteroidales bacterium]MCF8333710.1 hypothetical protein [Bacteroidales bacterium]
MRDYKGISIRNLKFILAVMVAMVAFPVAVTRQQSSQDMLFRAIRSGNLLQVQSLLQKEPALVDSAYSEKDYLVRHYYKKLPISATD